MSLRRLWHTFGVKLNLWYLLLFGGALLAGSVVADAVTRDAVADAHSSAVQDALTLMRSHYDRGGIPGLQAAVTQRDFIYVRVVDRHAQAVYERTPNSGPLPTPSLPTSPAERESGAARAAGEHWQVATVHMTDDRYLQVGLRDDNARTLLEVMGRTLLVVIAVAMAVALLGGVLLTWRARRPLQALRDTAARIIDSGDLAPRVPVTGRGDELDALGRLYNRLLDHNQRLIEAMRGSLDAVAHDLRTPLTRLRARAELPLSDPQLGATAREALADCVDEADRMMGMLSMLMDIAEAESGAMRLRRERVALTDVAADVADLYGLVADEAAVALRVEVPAQLTLLADRGRLRQALANLVDNALKFTPRGGSVTIRAAPKDAGVELVVSDTGPGVAPGDEARIWQRLFRADAARSTPGLGLGLALVRAVVEAHGGRTGLTRNKAGGADFIIWLPVGEVLSGA